MSERKPGDIEIVLKQYTSNPSLFDEDEIIDVSALDFDDTDAWLYVPTRCSEESRVHDLYAWLKSDPELVPPNTENANRRCIDTRTFTRPKKRSSRISFESIFETMSPSSQNLWKTQGPNFTNIPENVSKNSGTPFKNKEDVIPPMLKTAAANLLYNESLNISGQESMEVFLNMSHSKGIDSFINLTEPGFSDPLMNVSQPSIFCSSITSLPRDDSLNNTDCDKEEEKSEALNNINETFSRVDSPCDNKNSTVTSANRTFTNQTQTFERMDPNETYNADATSTTLIVLETSKDKGTNKLSSTFTSNSASKPVTAREKKDLVNLDATYLPSDFEKAEPISLDTTHAILEPGNTDTNKDTTLTIESYKDQSEKRVITNCSTPTNLAVNALQSRTSSLSSYENALDSTFKLHIPLCNQSTPKNAEPLNSTFKTFTKHLEQSRIYNPALCSNFKAPTSLRRELLAEIQRSGERKFDSTYNHVATDQVSEKKEKESLDVIRDENVRNDIPIENKYNTYKKESSFDRTKTRVVETIGNDTNEACVEKNQQDRKFYTFTKKTLNHGGKTDIENAVSLENVDSTFIKPFPKLQKRKQQHIPRMLSKLPQFLQKSNPNLVSNSNSLKAVNMTGCTNAANVGYMKGSQPNIVRDVEKSLTNKLYSLGKIKSGSEQRLLELNSNPAEFQMTAAGGSTESIESTQSAHSAPDLDDRLSTCSDCSHNSYTAQTMNIEQLHQIVRMQEESLKQESTPKLNRRVLENTWIETKKDLISPILKNGIDCCVTDSPSPLSVDHTVKTSSPLLSPTGSSQSINNDVHPAENILQQQNDVTGMKKIDVSNKPSAKMENKTRLRQPTNWNTGGNRASNVTSAIPRPASRIPALRFTRPATKNTQGDVKRAYM